MITNKKKRKKSLLHSNSSFIIVTYLARGKYIVESIKTEPDRRIYQQVLSSPRLKDNEEEEVKMKTNEIYMYT